MVSINYDTCYVSCACNPSPHVVDWNFNGLVCYGASNFVILYRLSDDGEGGRVISTLLGHKGRVNTVKWIKSGIGHSYKNEVVSGSSDNTAVVWSLDQHGNFIKSSILSGHESPVTVVDAIYRVKNENLESVVLTGSVDSTVRIWFRTNKDSFNCTQIINIPSNGLCLSLTITVFNEVEQDLLIGCGFDDSKITLYAYSDSDDSFVKQASLSGHEDWIRALDFTVNDDEEVMLASASQDATVRLWRFTLAINTKSCNEILRQKKEIIQIGKKDVHAVLEGVLAGHEGWIYGLQWHPAIINEHGVKHQPMQLLTSSLDKTLVIWAPEEESGVWLEIARMGEIGGNGLGFYGACYGPFGSTLLVHGFNGGIHVWKRKEDLWEPGVSITGHFNSVIDLTWEAVFGRYILSVSLDQTTRLHAPWVRKKEKTWHEIARPQVHGYDMSCIAALPNFSFVSGAEEKVIRAFTAPKNFLENFERLCCSKADNEIEKVKDVLGAAVPALGLSNRAVYNVQNENRVEENKLSREQYCEAYFVPQDLKAPPTEDNLSQNTLWPEVMKLYGHGYEIFALAASHDGKIVASACKATSVEHAAIILWETTKWQKIKTITSHQLTVTQLAFSPDDTYLLSVSRDRCWSLLKKKDVSDKMADYELFIKTDKKTAVHTRIIWTCAWAHTGSYFGTGSRDGKVVIWKPETLKPSTFLEFCGASITALAFSPSFNLRPDEYLVSIGFESGKISLYGCFPHVENSWQCYLDIVGNYGHALSVKKLAFRPVPGRAGETDNNEDSILQLASCGLDHTVKLYSLFIKSDVR